MKKPTYRKPPRPLEAGPAGLIHWVGMCRSCGKHWYICRDEARKVARQHHPRKGTYRCPVRPALWHVGQLTGSVRHGYATRTEVYGKREVNG